MIMMIIVIIIKIIIIIFISNDNFYLILCFFHTILEWVSKQGNSDELNNDKVSQSHLVGFTIVEENLTWTKIKRIVGILKSP